MDIQYGSRDIHTPSEIIAVGDIHGAYEELEDILRQVLPILDKREKCHLIFCGDYCNRGPNSAKVFELLIDVQRRYPEQSFFILGNHEEMLISALKGKSIWSEYTDKTWDDMASHWKVPLFSVQDLVAECLKRGVVTFLDSLIPYYESVDYLCTHAPIDRSYNMILESYNLDFGKKVYQDYFLEDNLNTLRWGFTLEDPKLCRIDNMLKFHICGHQFKHHKQPRLFKHRAFIDVGCGARPGKPLVAVHFPSKKVYRSFSKSL